MPRRSVETAVLAALAAVAFLTGAGCASKDTGGCDPGQVLCGGCYDPGRYQTDASNCGGCGIACGPGATCSGGTCVCGPGTSLCGNLSPRCRDLQNDAAACGTCENSCSVREVGWTCQQGACGCFGDRTECGTVCTDTANDPNNCGVAEAGCGNACKTRALCVSGVCECPPDLPDACATACTNLQNDTANCGGCGAACDVAGEVCSGALCQCPPLLPDRCPTNGLPASCVSLATDEQNCGNCGIACATGQTCTSGSCVCPSGQILCGNACIPCAGGSCNGSACSCPAGPPSGCNGQCCAGGTACCGNGACQTQHSNGLGQFYFDCNPLYAPNQTTLTAATAAAAAWSPTGTTIPGQCGPFCIGRQGGNQCAVWCFADSPVAGRVQLNALSAVCVCPDFGSRTWN